MMDDAPPPAGPLPAGGYVFANATGVTDARTGESRSLLDDLAATLDPFTRRRLEEAGVRPGARCLEVGAGAGTVARWLAEQVGPHGRVVATDVDPQPVPPHPSLTVVRHDIVADPLEEGAYDVVHARLVLAHLPQRERVLERLVAALAPGGVLVVEEFDPSWDRCVLHAPDPDVHRLFAEYHRALMATLRAAGTDPGWGRRLHHAMTEAGLTAVSTEFWARAWRGGEPGCRLAYVAAGHVRAQLVDNGMSPSDIDRFRTLVLDPRLVIHGNLGVSAMGRRS